MKRKEVLYDEIITEYNGEKFKHGEVICNKMPQLETDEVELLSLHIDLGFVIAEKDNDDFVKSLTELVAKYSR